MASHPRRRRRRRRRDRFESREMAWRGAEVNRASLHDAGALGRRALHPYRVSIARDQPPSGTIVRVPRITVEPRA